MNYLKLENFKFYLKSKEEFEIVYVIKLYMSFLFILLT